MNSSRIVWLASAIALLAFDSLFGQNLVVNPGFENGLSGWQAVAGQGNVVTEAGLQWPNEDNECLFIDPGFPYEGEFFFSSAQPDGAAGGQPFVSLAQEIPIGFIDPGTELMASCFVAGAHGPECGQPPTSDDEAWIELSFYMGGSAGALLSSVSTDKLDPQVGAWNLIELPASVPQGADTVVLTYVSELQSGYNSIDIGVDGFALTVSSSASCQPACDELENAICYEPGLIYDSSRAVGRLLLDGLPRCTGWIIAEPNFIITNRHCLTTGMTSGPLISDLTRLAIEFNYECSQCSGGSPKPTQQFQVVSVIHDSVALDYAVLQVEGSPATVWGVAQVDATPLLTGEQVYEVNHGDGAVKGIATGFVLGNLGPACGVVANVWVTTPGSMGASGSPIYRQANARVAAFRHCGLGECGDGYGVPMGIVAQEVLPFILAAGGTPSFYGVDPSAQSFIRGDVNGDGRFEPIADALFLLVYGFLPGASEPPCLESGDADGDGSLNVLADGLWILTHVFLGGPPPGHPHPDCGADPAPLNALGCTDSACP